MCHWMGSHFHDWSDYNGVAFAWYVPLASQSPYPIIVYSVANYRPIDILVTFEQIFKFLVTFYFFEFTMF